MAEPSTVIETLDKFRARYERPPLGLRHNPMKEKPPDDKWFCLDTAAIHEKLEHIEHRGTKILQRASPEDKELVKFQKAIPRIGVLPSKKTMTIAIVGKQGMGKSSLCNALLQRPDLAETSNRGKACTQYMTRYVFRPGNDDRRKVSDVSVKFLDKATIRELLSRLIGQYEFFHFVTQEPDTDYSEEEDLANSAEQVLRLVYNADIDDASEKTLNSLLTAHAIEKGELLHSSIGMAMQRIEEAGADDDGIKSMYELNDRQVREKRTEAAALWPLLEEVIIATGGVLLRNGIVILDVPGFGDTNQTRVAVAHAARRKADHEFIVVEPGRIETDKEVVQMLRASIKAHGTSNTTLVINKIDDVTNETAISKEITNCQDHPFPIIHQYYKETCLSEEDDEEKEDLDEEDAEIIIAYRKYLKECAQNALLQSRERETERKIQTILKNLNEPIRIFSISADIYNQWLTPIANRPDWSPENTRVPQLRRFALGLTSQSNYELYRDHCFITTPKTILDKLDRILTKHSDNDGYSRARKQFIDRIPILAEQLQGHITACLEMGLPRVWKGKSKSLQLEKVLQEVNKWSARLRWQTFHKVIQDGGIPINSKAKAFIGLDIVNLNYDILQTMQTPLSDWKVDMQWTAREVAASLNNTINSTEKQLSSCLDNFSGNENLKRRALEAWNDQKRLIRAHMKRFESKLQDHVSNIYKYATTEEDILCPVAKLNKPYYLRASRIQRGNGLHARQLADFKDGLTRHGTNAKSFVHRYEDIVHHKSKDELMSALDEFKISIIGFFEEFLEIMQEFLITTSFLKPGNFSIREELRQWYPEVQKDIKELQQFFRNEMPEEDGATTALDEQPSGEPAAKRTKLSAKLST